ncbi:MAG: DUF5722 domain-containing protein [Lachnospiraceae bacterium]|nr:DUF5722 domain-containing protein [Lachnospiraceae bacterium]
MKKRWSLRLALVMLFALMVQMTVMAAEQTVTINSCLIAGDTVTLTAFGTVPASDDGVYYLFELKPYQTEVGARTDYCAAAPAAETATFTTPLDYGKTGNKLYSRFVVTTLQGGVFVPVRNEMYITNPEALATKTTGYPVRSKKGLTADWRYSDELSDLGVGYAAYELDISRFCTGGGTNYTYNGKTYSFNSSVVSEYDIVCQKFANEGCNVVMVIKNSFNAATADLILPTARVAGKNCYAMNTAEQGGAEKIEALMSFLAERYSGSKGTIHTWIIGNEINNNSPWHYAGDMDAQTFSAQYAKEFRLCYNAIKSQNAGARVYINIDQRWNFTDGTPNQYAGRTVLDSFAENISQTGNIDWGLSLHPHPVPLYNCQFWNMPAGYAAMNLIDHTDNSKMVNPMNVDVVTNHMTQASMLAPDGNVRHIRISEMGFTSYNATYPTDETIQAAAMVYAYKLTSSNPFIEGVIIHRQVDNASEVANDGMAVGIRTESGKKYAYDVFKYMDTGNTAYTDFALPIIGAASWADLGLN